MTHPLASGLTADVTVVDGVGDTATASGISVC
jgi:hypothetical protein